MTENAAWMFELLRVFAALMVVLGLTWIVLRFLLPRLVGSGRLHGTAEIRVLGMRPLDRQVKLAIVEAEGQRLLLAVAPGGVTCLSARPLSAEPAGEEPEGAGPGPLPPTSELVS